MEKLKNELVKLLNYLGNSKDSVYSHETVEEIKIKIMGTINKLEKTGKVDKEKIDYLLVPTGDLQEISIDNGWGDDFIIIAENIEKLI